MSDENAVPGAAVETAAPTAPGGEGSAPSQTDTSAPVNSGAGSVETPEESRQNSGLPKWAYAHERQLREQKRVIAALEARLAQQPDSRAPKGPEQNGVNPKDVWSNPDDWWEEKFQSAQQKAEIRQKKTDALKFLRSQEDVTPDNEDEIASVLDEKGLIGMMETNPKYAVELALGEWRKSRGINTTGQPDPAKQLAKDQARGFAGAAASGGLKVWSKAEIDRIANDPEQWAKHGQDIKAAVDAGRVRN